MRARGGVGAAQRQRVRAPPLEVDTTVVRWWVGELRRCCEKILDFVTVALSFVCDKYYLIMNQLGPKDLSRNLQLNCIISFYFHLYLMLYVYAERFDVTENLKTFGF